MSYKYEIHAHTSQSSRCSAITGEELVEFYHELGFTGIFVTDHFFNSGSTTTNREMAWEEKVAVLCRGYDAAYARGRELGLDVFFAWEYTCYWNDYLTYGLDKKWLLENPDCDRWSPGQYFDKVRECGGLVVQAHPFRQGGDIPICLFPHKAEGVEVCNASMTDFMNDRAARYAEEYDLLKVVGSDTHTAKKKYLAFMVSDKRIASEKEFVESVRNNEFEFEKQYL